MVKLALMGVVDPLDLLPTIECLENLCLPHKTRNEKPTNAEGQKFPKGTAQSHQILMPLIIFSGNQCARFLPSLTEAAK